MITRTIAVILGYLCVAGYVANGQYCNTTNTCPGNQQCLKPYSFCNWGYCNCPAGMKSFNTSTCVTPTVNVGGNCSFDSDCKGTFTSCNTTMLCACWSGYTVKPDSSDCTSAPSPPTKPLNNTCTSTTQCGDGTSCNNICQCLPGYKPVGGNNVDCRQILLNEACSNVTDCGQNAQSNPAGCMNANCNNGTYQCNSNYWWVTSNTFSFQGGCVPKNVSANVPSGQPCTYDPVNNKYQLCGTDLICVSCFENPANTGTCQPYSAFTTTTTTQKPGGSASNVQVNIMALVAALAFFRFAA